jgi:hypothetical protein
LPQKANKPLAAKKNYAAELKLSLSITYSLSTLFFSQLGTCFLVLVFNVLFASSY